MAEEKANSYILSSPRQDAEAYSANFGAHRVGISPQEMAEYYSQWARQGTYDEDLSPERYRGPTLAADVIAQTYLHNRHSVKILDVAAGTGRLGTELHKQGFRCLDGLDPAEGMLAIARKKNIYRHLFCEFMPTENINIPKGDYDVIAVAGGMGEGHIPCKALREMVRITKSGHVVIVMREEYLDHVAEYKDRLEPIMLELEDQGLWQLLQRNVVPNYSFDNNGVIFLFKVC
ncbi:hypothetical protein FSP39_024296 [Pinctada imbricata]|uniref:Methyltransferase domain-containing protein n=1 Tax=Pinctada imbricata TaxID=66713 RepID=A0AA89BUA7_PINIB|nr:hypothetical protein FSP39_024296 [Pinctada imbricata]